MEGEKGGKRKGKKAREAVCRKDARSGGFCSLNPRPLRLRLSGLGSRISMPMTDSKMPLN